MVSHLPSRFKRPDAWREWKKNPADSRLPVQPCVYESQVSGGRAQLPCAKETSSCRECSLHPFYRASEQKLQSFLSKLRASSSVLRIGWEDKRVKKSAKRWHKLVDVVIASAKLQCTALMKHAQGRCKAFATISQGMVRREARCRRFQVQVLIRWVKLMRNAERALALMRSAMDQVERWHKFVGTMNDRRLEYLHGCVRLRAHNYRRIRQAGDARPFTIAVQCDIAEIRCSVFMHEKVATVVEHALGMVAFDTASSHASLKAVCAAPDAKRIIRGIGRAYCSSVRCFKAGGTPLQDNHTLADCGICAGATLCIRVKVRGGMQSGGGEAESSAGKGSNAVKAQGKDSHLFS